MSLTLDRLREINIPLNVSNKPNNLSSASRGLNLYNDSVNLYEALTLFGGSSAATDLSNTTTGTSVTILSSSGLDTLIASATTTQAGVMSATDKVNLSALSTLSGVSSGALNLGTFTGNIIPDNSTIKAALQALETTTETIPVITKGNLTTGNSALSITNGSLSVIGSGTTLTFVPANVLLNTLGGTLGYSQLSTTGATNGQFLTFNGTSWAPTTYVPTIPSHNSLTGKQGGSASEYYHINESLYNTLTNTTEDTILGKVSIAGEVEEITLANSIVFSGSTIELENDEATPGNSKYYGTSSLGVKGWQDIASLSGVTEVLVSNTSDITLSVVDSTTTPDISAVLTTTGVTNGSYGSSSAVGTFTVDSKGRLTAASSTAIAITSSAVTNFSEAVDDRVNNLLVAGSNITLTYNDGADTLTIAATASTVNGSGIANKLAYWIDSDSLSADVDAGFDGTYFTIGSPTAASLARLTTRGLGSTLSTYGYVHENSSNVEVFKVADNGAITVGALNDILIHPDQMNISAAGEYAISKSGGDLTLYADTQVKIESGSTTTSTPSLKVVATRSSTLTGLYNLQVEGTFSPSTGSNAYTDLHVKTIVNQSGGTSPIRSLYIQPTLTAAINYTGLEINAPGHMALKTAAGNVSFNFGSDATGDIYYRNSSGNLTRLPVGTSMQVLGSNGTVPTWTTTAGSLPGGSEGDFLIYTGGAWTAVAQHTETQTGLTGTAVTLAMTPLTGTQLMLFRNGQYLTITEDFTRTGPNITLNLALVSTDKITAIYYYV